MKFGLHVADMSNDVGLFMKPIPVLLLEHTSSKLGLVCLGGLYKCTTWIQPEAQGENHITKYITKFVT